MSELPKLIPIELESPVTCGADVYKIMLSIIAARDTIPCNYAPYIPARPSKLQEYEAQE